MKISILTPSYNDASSIIETLNSIKEQTYKNWEHIIIDDGSTDNTKEVIEAYKKDFDPENKIKYIYQNNSDQLNALINGMQYITGDYVYTLHSDDLIPSNTFFDDTINFFKVNPTCEAMTGDLLIINEKSEITNCWKALKYRRKKFIPSLVMLNYGANIYGDVAVQKKTNFFTNAFNNYLTWNTPFWIKMDNHADMVNVKKAPFPTMKYRIHEGNYANNEVGKFNALNGELRALTRLMEYYNIPLFGLQRGILKILRARGIRRFCLTPYFHPVYFNREQNNKVKIIIKAISNTYPNGYETNEFLTALVGFYKNSNSRSIEINRLNESEIYKGKDIRIFTKKLFAKELPDIYYQMFQEMKEGFSSIDVPDEVTKELVISLVKFLNLYPYVIVKVKGE